MDNCINEPIGKPKSYFKTWHNLIMSQSLYVEVIAGPLKGTTGRYIGIDIHYWSLQKTRDSWNHFYYSPSDKNWTPFRDSVMREEKKPKLIILVNDKPWETIKVSIANCAWSFTPIPLNKVSKPRPKKEIVEEDIPDVFDHLGEKINIGDFCSYILYHHRCSGAQIYYGNVTKITKNGDVYCTDVNVGDWPEGHSTSKEKKVLYPNMITVLNENIMDRILMARLGS